MGLDEVTRECRKLHNEELNDLYSSTSIIGVIKPRRMTWFGHATHMEANRGAHRILMGKPEGKRPLGRPRLRWEDNIKMYPQEVGWGCMDWVDLAQYRDMWWALVNAEMNLGVP